MAITLGVHSSCNLAIFDAEERAAIETISKDWFVTHSGNPLTFNQNVTYKYILIKPTDHIQQAFNLERELVCVFSPFDDIHPRTLDAIARAQGDEYVFRVDALKEYIAQEARYQRINLTNAEKLAEISERRNKLEPQLRSLCRSMLQAFYGIATAKQKILEIFGQSRATTLGHLDYADLFSPERGQIYFEDLRKTISKHWDCFKNVIGPDQEKVLSFLKHINEFRSDAHAKSILEDDFQMLRLAFNYFDAKLKEFTS